jgi:hypothetical protein
MLVGASMSLFQTWLLRVTRVVDELACLLGKIQSKCDLKVRCHVSCK